jgi:DNA-binding LytR/AlgR family response regulator
MELLLVNDQGVPGIVQVDEICMVIPTKNGPEFVTRWGNFHYPQTAAELISQFSAFGYVQVDRNAIVNLDKANFYDPIQRKLYFEDDLPTGERIWATVSAANIRKVNHLVRENRPAYLAYAG